MTSLHIQHTVHDFDRWLETFRSFDDFRAEGGVQAVQVRHGVDDPNLVSVDLEFESAERARTFLGQLETRIWPNQEHFDGTPTAHILQSV